MRFHAVLTAGFLVTATAGAQTPAATRYHFPAGDTLR
jgi:hypothetical protein